MPFLCTVKKLRTFSTLVRTLAQPQLLMRNFSHRKHSILTALKPFDECRRLFLKCRCSKFKSNLLLLQLIFFPEWDRCVFFLPLDADANRSFDRPELPRGVLELASVPWTQKCVNETSVGVTDAPSLRQDDGQKFQPASWTWNLKISKDSCGRKTSRLTRGLERGLLWMEHELLHNLILRDNCYGSNA